MPNDIVLIPLPCPSFPSTANSLHVLAPHTHAHFYLPLHIYIHMHLPLYQDVPPVLATSKYYLVSIYRSDVFLMATTTGETKPLLILEFLHRVFEIFEEYFDSVDEASVKDNFSTCYQLLEEMMDYGFPLTTEPNALKAMIQPPSVMSRLANATGLTMGGPLVSDELPGGTISNMPWRKAGVKYSQNEIFLDVIEEVDAIVDRSGMLISSEVSGVIAANSRLSGVPDLLLSFVDPSVIDDCSFHPCVRYNRFERDKVISFVPPDGAFELMRYRVHTHSGTVAAPCYCQPQFSFPSSSSSISSSSSSQQQQQQQPDKGNVSILVGVKPQNSLQFSGGKRPSTLTVEDVEVVVPFSRAVRTASLHASVGTVLFDETTKVSNRGKEGE